MKRTDDSKDGNPYSGNPDPLSAGEPEKMNRELMKREEYQRMRFFISRLHIRS